MSASHCKNITQTTYVANNKSSLATLFFSMHSLTKPFGSHTDTHTYTHWDIHTHTLCCAEKSLTQRFFFLPTNFGVQVNASEWLKPHWLSLVWSGLLDCPTATAAVGQPLVKYMHPYLCKMHSHLYLHFHLTRRLCNCNANTLPTA